MSKNDSNVQNTKAYQREITAFITKDLAKFENPEELISQISSIATESFSNLDAEYQDTIQKYEVKQREALELIPERYNILVWSLDINSSYRKTMSEYDRSVAESIVSSIAMETALGRIFLGAILRCSQIQWGKPVKVSKENIAFIAKEGDTLTSKLRNAFFESYDSGKSLRVNFGKNYKSAVNTIASLLPESFGHKVFEILLKEDMKDLVKRNEGIMKSILLFIPEKNAKAIKLYFGIGTVCSYNFEKIAELMEISAGKAAVLFEDGMKLIKWKARTVPEVEVLLGAVK